MLSDQRQQAFLAQGFVRIPRVLGDEDLSMLQSEWSRLWREVDGSHPSVQWRCHGENGKTADRIDPAYPLSSALRALCADCRLTELAAQLLGAPVVLFKDKLISKGPDTDGYDLHQDWPYWADYGVPADRMVTLMIALDPSDAQNGALQVWPTAEGVLAAPDDEARDVDPAALDLSIGVIASLDPGDILLLHPLAPHRSAPNRSEGFRRAYFVTYVTAEYAPAAKRFEAERLRMLAFG